jgi:ABC-2 type transport system permease protein
MIIAGQELRQLWLGGRGLLLLVGFAVFLSIYTYLLATSEDLTRTGQTSLIGLLMEVTVILGVLLVLVISTDSFSGERDRSTLEALLLTPVQRRHIALGKFIGALSLWAGMLVVSIPYLALPAHGTGLFGHSVALSAVVGTIIVVGFYFLGTIVSAVSRSNLTSFTLSLFAFFALFAPLQLPGNVMDSPAGEVIVRSDPVSAGSRYMADTLANGGIWGQESGLLVAPVIFLVLMVVLALFLVDRYLSLQGGRSP